MKKLKFNPFIIPITLCLIGMGKYTIDTIDANRVEKAYEDEFVKESTDEIRINDEVIAVVPTIEETPVIEEVEETLSYELIDNNYEFKSIDFTALNEINEEVVGWLSVDGVINDFPIVQGDDNKEYLHTDLYGNYSNSGNPFMDYRSTNDPDNLGRLTVIYGHHMKNGTGFGDLCEYKNEEFITNHPYGVYYSEDGKVYMVKFFAGIVVDGSNGEILDVSSLSDKQYNEYISSIKNQSYFSNNIAVDVDDNLLALVTCSYETNNSRFILYGVLEEQYTLDNRSDRPKTLSR